jgi:hypothetical protein
MVVGELSQPHSGRQAAVAATFRGLLDSFLSNASAVVQQWFEIKMVLCTTKTGARPLANGTGPAMAGGQ